MRSIMTIAKSQMPRISLTEEFPVDNNFESKKTANFKPVLTKLKNGIQVVSQDNSNAIATIGLFVKTGPFTESIDLFGQASFLSKIAFSSSTSTTSFAITQQLERLGAIIDCQASRDGIFYSINIPRKFSSTALDIIQDTVFSPAFHIHELNNAKFEYQTKIEENKNSDEVMEDLIHRAAFGEKGHGVPLMASREMLDKMTKHTLSRFCADVFRPSNIVISAVGVEPDSFHSVAEQFFSPYQGFVNDFADYKNIKSGKKEEQSEYKGNEIRNFIEDNHSLTFLSIAFPTEGWLSKELPSLCVLGSLLGGGSSFSVGGPGKGMHSRLYASLLCRSTAAESVNVFGHIHSDVGLFGVTGTCPFSAAKDFTKEVVREIKNLPSEKALTDEAFERARNGALSTYLFEAENGKTLAEDSARLVNIYGRVRSASEVSKDLLGVTKEEVLRVAKKLVSSRPSLVVRGNSMVVPGQREIEESLKM